MGVWERLTWNHQFMKAPVYIDHGKTYHVDTCAELRGAVARGELSFSAICRGSYPGRQIPDKMLPGICSVGFWDATQKQSWGLPWHRNEGIELTWLETGSLDFNLDSKAYTLKPGELTITRPWQPHKLGAPNIGIGRLHWLILDISVRQPHQEWQWPKWIVLTKKDLLELTDFLRRNEQPVWPCGGEIAHCFKQMTGSIDTEIEAAASKTMISVNALLLSLLEMFRSKNVPLSTTLTSARRSTQFFLDRLSEELEEPWTLDTMAEECNMGVTRFTHHCKKITNLAPMQYLNQMRLAKAARIFATNPKASVTETAFECGFSSSQYFATLFRKQYKCTPCAYKELAKSP